MSEGMQRATNAVKQMTAVLDADPALAEAIPPRRRMEARAAAIAPVEPFRLGSWDPLELFPEGVAFGLLVLRGLVVSHVEVGALRGIEFVGPGDLLRPAALPPLDVRATRRWEVVESGAVAVLDTEFAVRVRPWPEIPATLLQRQWDRGESLAYQLAARQAVRVEDRLVLILGQLAERYGRVSPQGTVLHLPGLSHEILARAVGARRSPVTKALGELRRRGVVEQGRAGELVLLRAE